MVQSLQKIMVGQKAKFQIKKTEKLELWQKNVIWKIHSPFYTSLYKYSSSYVHSSAFSVSTRPDLSQIKIFFQAAMHFIESEINDYLRESKLPAKDAVIMRNILVFLYQDFEKLDKNLKGDL